MGEQPMSRCSSCGRFLKAHYPFDVCPRCRSVRDSEVLGVDEHGIKVGTRKAALDEMVRDDARSALRSIVEDVEHIAASEQVKQRPVKRWWRRKR